MLSKSTKKIYDEVIELSENNVGCYVKTNLKNITHEEIQEIKTKQLFRPIIDNNSIKAMVCYIDKYGNLMTNVTKQIFKDVGTIGLTYFVPIMAAYTAYSISDTPGIAPGFIVGVLAQQIDTGYLGALLGGILVGYATYMLMKLELPSGVEVEIKV